MRNNLELSDETYNKIKTMTRAGLESVYWRQDQYGTGGIVESDERYDEGRKLYWPWCWPREYIVQPLLAAGQHERVRRFLDFWLSCQREDGGWLHCYDVRDGKEYPGLPETDNVGYLLAHFGNYYQATNDIEWLRKNWPAIRRAGEFLESKYFPQMQMIWGHEEAELPGYERTVIRYSLHINCVCVWGLRYASELANAVGDHNKAVRWREIAEAILSSIRNRLWDQEEKTFSFGFTETNERLTTPVLWMSFMPFWLFDDEFSDVCEDTIQYINQKCFDKDPIIPSTYWLYDLSPVLASGKELSNEYSGHGVWIGGLPVVVDALLKVGRFREAREQLEIICRFTSPDSNLIPEHVNTLHKGKLGNYQVYPQESCRVDPGNLLHLSFFLTMISRHFPECITNI